MSTTTQCPHCGTRFKATQAQLEAYHGMVRCGNCQAAFDAIEHRCDDSTSPQLALPIMPEELTPTAAFNIDAGGSAAINEVSGKANELHADDYPELAVKRTNWPLAVLNLLLLLLLLGQATYLFRVEIAARMPGLKPMLLEGCRLLQCDIPLPRDADLMSIDSSDMQADPAQGRIITLTITLRNLASYVQAYPNLELTLNDINDVPVGRRIFHPAEYLRNAEDEKTGLVSNREKTIRLTIDADDLKAVGYRLYLFY
jgi:predicted Zn finger-like uncharacterized protein